MAKNDFEKRYTAIPDISGVRYYIFGVLLLANIVNLMIIDLFTIVIKESFMIGFTKGYFYFMVFIDIWAICLFIFAKRFSDQIYLFTAFSFTATSLIYLCMADYIIILEAGMWFIIYIVISIIIYLVTIFSVIMNVHNKISRNFTKQVNTKIPQAIGILSGMAIIFIPKPKELGNLPFSIILLILSYCLAFTCSGFHKYYLINKMKRENETVYIKKRKSGLDSAERPEDEQNFT